MNVLLLGLLLQDPVGVTLEDGSAVLVKSASEPLVVRTEFGDLRIPISEILSLGRKGEECVVRTARLLLQGKFAQSEMVFETEFGRLRVPTQEIRGMSPSRSLLETDERTVVFWAFDDPRALEASGMKMSDGTAAEDAGGLRVFVRKNENGYVQGTLPSDFRFADGPFTLEVRVKVGAVTRGYATLLACNEEANSHHRDFWFLAQAGGQLYFDSGNAQRTNFISQTGVVMNLREWNYVALVHDPKEGELRYYVNGARVHTDKRPLTFATSGGPLFLGPGSAGKAYFSCPERFQFARVTRGVRTDEEIAEWQKMLENDPTVASVRSPGRGLALRDQSFLRCVAPALIGARFKTRFGTLELREKTRGRIDIYPFREKDLEKLRSEIDRLIDALSSRSIDEREEAQRQLLRIGAPAYAPLVKAKETSDPEVAGRVEAILKQLVDSGVARQPVCDVLRMGRTVLHGWLELDEIEVQSKYGNGRANLKNVRRIVLSEPERSAAGPVLRLRSGESVEADLSEVVLQLETEFGSLRVPCREVVFLRYQEDRKHWVIKTEKATLTGRIAGEKVPLSTPVGPVLVPPSDFAEFGR